MCSRSHQKHTCSGLCNTLFVSSSCTMICGTYQHGIHGVCKYVSGHSIVYTAQDCSILGLLLSILAEARLIHSKPQTVNLPAMIASVRSNKWRRFCNSRRCISRESLQLPQEGCDLELQPVMSPYGTWGAARGALQGLWSAPIPSKPPELLP